MNEHIDLADPPGPAPLQPDVVAPLPGNPRARNIFGSLIALFWLIIVAINSIGAVTWTSDEQVAVFGAGSIVLAFLGAIYAHQLKGTKKEPIAIGTFFTLLVPSVLALNASFVWIHWTSSTSSLIGLVATPAVGTIALIFSRSNATADQTPI